MRVLFITSFYSGLQESVIKGSWNPSGMPAIYKLFEGLKARKHEFDSIFVSTHKKNKSLYKVDFFPKASFYELGVMPKSKLLVVFKRWIYFWTLFQFLRKMEPKKYDCIYLDRANVSAVLILKYVFKQPVFVLRLHGIGFQFRKFSNSWFYKLKKFWNYIAYKYPFQLVIASRDGTPTFDFMEAFCNKDSKKLVLLNGVDQTVQFSQNKDSSTKKIRFLFVSRLEKDKGIHHILEVFSKFSNQNIELIIVGAGSFKQKVEDYDTGQNCIRFLGSLPHDEVMNLFLSSDVFLSLNHLGNISNVVLEAVAAKKAIITFARNEETKQDMEAYRFLEDNAFYIDTKDINKSLENVINKLISNPDLVHSFQNKIAKNVFPKLQSWEERIDQEIELILNEL